MWMNQNLLAIFHQSGGDETTHLTDTLFKNLVVPTFIWQDDPEMADGWVFSKADLCYNILWRYGEQCSLIGDPDDMADAIGNWSRVNIATWMSLYKSLFFKFNPTANVDYVINDTETTTGQGSKTTGGQSSGTKTQTDDDRDTYNEATQESTLYGHTITDTKSQTTTGQESSTTNTDTDSSSLTNKSIAAYNLNTLTPSESVSTTTDTDMDTTTSANRTETKTNSDTSAHSGTDSTTTSHTGYNDYDRSHQITYSDLSSGTETTSDSGSKTGARTVKGRNTSTNLAEAVMSWREYRSMNLYEIISAEFAKEFLIMIW